MDSSFSCVSIYVLNFSLYCSDSPAGEGVIDMMGRGVDAPAEPVGERRRWSGSVLGWPGRLSARVPSAALRSVMSRPGCGCRCSGYQARERGALRGPADISSIPGGQGWPRCTSSSRPSGPAVESLCPQDDRCFPRLVGLQTPERLRCPRFFVPSAGGSRTPGRRPSGGRRSFGC